MREESLPEAEKGSNRADSGRAASRMDRRFPVALLLYGALAALAWFTLDVGKVFVLGKPVEMRLIPLLILGGLALRTVLARQAERIRRGGDEGGSSRP
jgi:hypothetical protein